jgi:hypothetical protein
MAGGKTTLLGVKIGVLEPAPGVLSASVTCAGPYHGVKLERGAIRSWPIDLPMLPLTAPFHRRKIRALVATRSRLPHAFHRARRCP